MRMRRLITMLTAAIATLLMATGCANTISGSASADPLAVRNGGAVVVGQTGEKVARITVYLDFMCPACKQFEERDGDAIRSAVAAGKLRVEYRPLNFLDRQSASGSYSSRALAAFLAVGSQSDQRVTQKFLTALFAAQPLEGGSTDPDDAALARTAKKAGASDELVAQISGGRTAVDAVAVGEANSRRLIAAGGSGTPTVVHDGQMVSITSSGWLAAITG